MRTWKTGPRSRAAARVGAVLTLAAGAVLATATPSFAVADPITSVQPSRGPGGGGNTIMLTTTGADFAGTIGSGLGVEFSWNACNATYLAPITPAGSGTALTAGVVAATSATVQSNAKMLAVVVPAGVVAPGTMTAASYYVCVYNGNTATSSTLSYSTSTAAYTVSGVGATLSQTAGITGGGQTITLTAASGTIAATNVIQFQYAGTATAPQTCAATLPAATPVTTTGNPPTQTAGVIAVPSANITAVSGVTGAVKIKVPTDVALAAGQNLSQYNVCVYVSAAANAALVAGTTMPFQVAGTALNLGNTQGPAATSNTITATVPNGIVPAGSYVEAVLGGATGRAACPATYTTPAADVVAATSIRNLAPNWIAVTLPSGVVLSPGGSVTTDYWICVYSGNTAGSSTLVAGSQLPYTVAALATLTDVTPNAGSSLGGTQVTITGTNFQSATGVSVGGTPVQITYISPSGTTLIGNVPGHSAGGPFTVSVTTASGTVNLPSAFTFTNGIAVTPRSAPATKLTPTDLDVVGTGFASLTWTHTEADTEPHTDAANAHVYLVSGVYNATGGAGSKANGQVGECANVLVVSDTELVCQLDLNQNINKTTGVVTADSGDHTTNDIPDGTYTVTVVSDGAAASGYTKTVISSGSTFTVAPY